MTLEREAFKQVIQDSLSFDYIAGQSAVTGYYPQTTGWRQLPFMVTVHVLSGKYTFERDGHAAMEVGSGKALLIAPGVGHQISLQANTISVSSWAHLRFTLLGSIDPLSLLETSPVVVRPDAEAVGRINRELADLDFSDQDEWLLNIVRQKEYGLKLLSLILMHSQLKPNARLLLENVNRLAPVLRHVRDNYAGQIRVKDLAKLAYLSPSRFHVVFKEATGMAPIDYVLRLRMKEAQGLLVLTDLSVSQVARKVGYAGQFHFSRLFHSLCGMSPTEYRRNNSRWGPFLFGSSRPPA